MELGRKYYKANVANTLLITGVIISSLFSYFCGENHGNGAYWCFERWGLVWGILLLVFMDKVKRFVNPTRGKIVAGLLLNLVIGAAYLYFKPVFFYGEYMLKVVLGLTMIAFLFILSSRWYFGNKAVNFLGEISYEVYLSHGIIMAGLGKYVPELSSGLFILLTVLLTVIFSFAVHTVGKPIVKKCRV